jgi:hypothetical protein
MTILPLNPTNDNDEIDPSLMEHHIQDESVVVNQVGDIRQGIIIGVGVGVVRVDQDLLRQVNQSNQKIVLIPAVVVDLKGLERESVREVRKNQTRRNAEGVVEVRARVQVLNRRNLNVPRLRTEGSFHQSILPKQLVLVKGMIRRLPYHLPLLYQHLKHNHKHPSSIRKKHPWPPCPKQITTNNKQPFDKYTMQHRVGYD